MDTNDMFHDMFKRDILSWKSPNDCFLNLSRTHYICVCVCVCHLARQVFLSKCNHCMHACSKKVLDFVCSMFVH